MWNCVVHLLFGLHSQELEETKHVLTVRERKLLELSQLNAALNEENDTLRRQVPVCILEYILLRMYVETWVQGHL